MKYTQTIKKNHIFRRLYQKGKSSVSPFFAIYTLKNSPNYRGQGGGKKGKSFQEKGQAETLVGVTVGTKLGNAVLRNRVRRRIMALYRCHEEEIVLGHTVVIVARNRCGTATYAQMEQSFLRLMGQLSLLKEGTPGAQGKQAGGAGKRPPKRGPHQEGTG